MLSATMKHTTTPKAIFSNRYGTLSRNILTTGKKKMPCENCHYCRAAFGPITGVFIDFCCTMKFKGISELSDEEIASCGDKTNEKKEIAAQI